MQTRRAAAMIGTMSPAVTSVFDLPWTMLVPWAVYGAVYLGGLILGIWTWRRHPLVSLIVILVTAGLLVRSTLLLWEHTQPEFANRFRDMTMEERQIDIWLRGLPYVAAFVMLAIAAVLARHRTVPISTEEDAL
ncbi:MAG TPA: hypothetical protein VHM91_14615 [Verrucomicrobiales bacterium]|nr:hypothetical protein [Verrucomicrobiales bacterium]